MKNKSKSNNTKRIPEDYIVSVNRPTAMQKIYDYFRKNPKSSLTEQQIRTKFKVRNPRATLSDIEYRLSERGSSAYVRADRKGDVNKTRYTITPL